MEISKKTVASSSSERMIGLDMSLWLVLFLAGVTALDAMAIDMYLPTFPAVMRELQISEGKIQQTLSIFLVGLALGQGFCGPILDRFGRKRPLLVGLLIFVLGSVLAAMADGFSTLLFARLLQALGASFGLVVPRAIITDQLDANRSAKVFSVLMQVMMIAPVVAPLIGSYLAVFGGWRSVFLALAIFSGAALLWGLKITPETLPLSERKPMNIGFVLRSYWKLCSNKSFFSLSLAGAAILGALFVYISTGPFIFIQHFGLTPTSFSYIFAGNAVGMILCGQLNIYLLNRNWEPKRLAKLGLSVFTAGGVILLMLSFMPGLSWWAYLLPLWIAEASSAMIFGNLSALTMELVEENIGVASGLVGMIQYGVGAGAGLIISLLPQTISNLPAALILAGLTAFTLMQMGLKKREIKSQGNQQIIGL